VTAKLSLEQRGYPPPQGLPELREAVADQYRDEQGMKFDTDDEVLITAGATGALDIVLDTFVNPHDRVVLFDPSYLMYPLMIPARRGRVSWVRTESEDGRVRFALPELVRGLRRAKLVILNSPSNPTGCVMHPEDLEQLAWVCNRYDVLIFSDEVYKTYQYDEPFVSIASLPLARGRTLTAGSVSKSHALAAYRVGWLAADRHLLRPCMLTSVLRNPFVSTLSQQLALTALRLPSETTTQIRGDFKRRRDYAVDRLRGMGLNPTWPSGAFFIWVPVSQFQQTGKQFTENLLREKKVQVLPGEFFGPSGAGHIRISYAGDEGRLREGLNRLAESMRELAAALPAPLRVAA
jgi:aspartate/methionine/tyrosine aminotransferase